jgi:hypothetical protein
MSADGVDRHKFENDTAENARPAGKQAFAFFSVKTLSNGSKSRVC